MRAPLADWPVLKVISRHGAETILITIDGQWCIFEIIGQVLYLRTIDQLLPLQYAAHQQSDDDQHDGDFDEGEAFLLIFKMACSRM